MKICAKCGVEEPDDAYNGELYYTDNPNLTKTDGFKTVYLCIVCAQQELIGLNGIGPNTDKYIYLPGSEDNH